MYFTTDSGSSNNDVRAFGSSEAIGKSIVGSGFEMAVMAGIIKIWGDFKAPSITESERNFREQKSAFINIPPLALEQYRGHFVASLNGRIVDHDADYVSLVHRFFGTFGDTAVFITKIGERPLAVIDTPFVD